MYNIHRWALLRVQMNDDDGKRCSALFVCLEFGRWSLGEVFILSLRSITI